jgi:hypothetical protein
MAKILRTLCDGIRLICPACRTGGMAINAVLTATLAVSGAAVAFFTDIPILPLLATLVAATILFPLWFYRHARGLWVAILYLTGSINED